MEKAGREGGAEYAILTAEISKAAFGMTPGEYKKFKGLKRENLRDHMTDLELIFSMLGEAATTEITRKRDAQGCLRISVRPVKGDGSPVRPAKSWRPKPAPGCRRPENYLEEPESRKRLKHKRRTPELP